MLYHLTTMYTYARNDNSRCISIRTLPSCEMYRRINCLVRNVGVGSYDHVRFKEKKYDHNKKLE